MAASRPASAALRIAGYRSAAHADEPNIIDPAPANAAATNSRRPSWPPLETFVEFVITFVLSTDCAGDPTLAVDSARSTPSPPLDRGVAKTLSATIQNKSCRN